MDFGTQLTALENHIYNFAEAQFKINEIPPTIARLIIEGVYAKFQTQAIATMINNQTEFTSADSTEIKTGKPEDLLKTYTDSEV